jgi:phosphoribosyl 1,2-cyclic phosphate phosphodiesterase
MTGDRLEIRILGCGSSGGVPRIGNAWGACDPSEPKNRRTRCSILVRRVTAAGVTRVLVDTSPDMREQLLAASVTALDSVILTHEHADQCHGLDDLRALALLQRRRIPVYMDIRTADVVTRRFDYCFAGTSSYPAILELGELAESGGVTSLGGAGGTLDFLSLEQDHGSIPSKGFRIGNFAYCNDVVRLPEDTLARLGGLDLLVVDALRYTPHPTHANLDQALAWIEQLKPRRAVLTNMHVDLDYRTLKAQLPPHIVPAFDGMELSVDASA